VEEYKAKIEEVQRGTKRSPFASLLRLHLLCPVFPNVCTEGSRVSKGDQREEEPEGTFLRGCGGEDNGRPPSDTIQKETG